MNINDFNKNKYNVQSGKYEEGCISPSRGWYSIFPFVLPKLPDFGEYKYCLNKSESVCLVRISIKKYSNCELSSEALTAFEAILDFFVKNKKEIILRITYDDEGNALSCEPDNIELIISHMRALGNLAVKYENNIFTTQGLFVGSWGEMHSSLYVDNSSLITLAESWYKSTEGRLRMAVRRPSQRETLLKGCNIPELKGVLGLYNDALTASETDYGTYGAGTEYVKKWCDYQNSECNYVYNGGEVINENALNDAANAVEYFKRLHISYLNSQYDSDVINKWKNQELIIGRTKYNAYDYITDRLGYRLELKEIKVAGIINSELRLVIENTGFAALYFPVKISVCCNDNEGKKIIYEAEFSGILPGEKKELIIAEIKKYKGRGLEIYVNRLCDNRPVILF